MEEPITQKPKRKTHTSTAVIKKYRKKVYTRIYAELPKTLVAQFKESVKRNGTSTAAVFREAMERYLSEHPLDGSSN